MEDDKVVVSKEHGLVCWIAKAIIGGTRLVESALKYLLISCAVLSPPLVLFFMVFISISEGEAWWFGFAVIVASFVFVGLVFGACWLFGMLMEHVVVPPIERGYAWAKNKAENC